MLGMLAVSLLAVLSVWLHRRWVRVRSYWAERGVAFVPPHPVLGNLGFFQRKNPIVWMREQYAQYSNVPYIGVWWFWRPALIVRSPEVARNILVKDSDVFRNRALGGTRTDGLVDPIGTLNIFCVDDPVWSSIRRRLTTLFTSAKLRSLFEMKKTKAKELVERLKKEAEISRKTGIKIDYREIFTDFTTDVIGTASFGIRSDATLTGDSPIRKITRDFSDYSLLRGIVWTCIFFVPDAYPYLKLPMFPTATTDYFRSVWATVVSQRNGKTSQSKYLMDALITIKAEAAKEGEDLSDDLLIAQGIVFIQGGYDTTSTALTFTVYELAYNPDVQEKLYKEVSAAKEKLGDAVFDPTILAELPYLNAVIKESLRKYPTMGWLDRVASQRYKVDETLTIEKGTPVYVCAAGMHYDPEYFPDPHKYDPERFMPENEGDIKPYTYMPFGDGPRKCIGLRFGQQTMRIAVAALSLGFAFTPHGDAPAPADVTISERGMFISPSKPLSVQFTARQ